MRNRIISFFLESGVDRNTPSTDNERIKNTNLYSLLFSFISLFYSIFFFVIGLKETASYILPIPFIFWFSILANYLHWFNLARISLLFFSNAVVYLFAVSLGRNASVHLWFFVAGQLPFFLFDLDEIYPLVISVLISVFALLILRLTDFQYGLLPPAIFPVHEQNIIAVFMIGIVSVTTFFMTYSLCVNYRDLKLINVGGKMLQTQYIKALNSTVIVTFTDIAGRIIYVNDRFCKTTGYSANEVIGKTHRILKSDYHSQEFFSELWAIINSKNIWSGEICNKRKNGELYWVYTNIIPILNKKNAIEGFMSIRFDVTGHKKIQEKIIYDEKMASLAEMSRSIAHEINNPLTIIQGDISYLQRTIKNGPINIEDLSNTFKNITDTSERMASIIRGLRSFARIGTKDLFKNELLESILSDVGNLCRERFKSEGISLDFNIPNNSLIECRRTQLVQMLVNLLTNSLEAVSELSQKWVKVNIEDKEDSLKIMVIDSGNGIPDEIADKVMLPFFTTKKIGSGTGLGLSVAVGIIADHNGKIWIDKSSPNTKFVIEIPLKQNKQLSA